MMLLIVLVSKGTTLTVHNFFVFGNSVSIIGQLLFPILANPF